MAKTPDDRRYSSTHEWALQEGNFVVVGITAHAVSELGDLVFIDLPEVGDEVTAGGPFGEIESVKAVSELNSPVTGTVAEVNSELEGSLQALTESPYDEGWMIRIESSDPNEANALMTFADYEQHIKE